MCHVLENLSDPAWHSLLRHLLIEYVTLLTNPEGPAPSAPSRTRQEVLERDAARQEAHAAAAAAAAAGGGGGGGGGGDGSRCGGGGVDDDDDDDALEPGGEEAAPAKPAAKRAKGKAAWPGKKQKK